jgi:GT2 family glycosyltransferase
MDLSIVIINFNTFDLTRACIASVYQTLDPTRVSFEIILVDNGSTDRPADAFTEFFPELVLIKAGENLGFGRANNEGMHVARGRFFLLLNSDTIALPGALEQCFTFMTSPFAVAQNIGLLGCRLLNEDKTLQPSIWPYLNNSLWTFFKIENPIAHAVVRRLGRDKHQNFDFNRSQRVGDVSGAFMFLRADVARDTGYFDTDFFMYCEDTEWIRERIARRYTVYYFAEASIVHLGGKSAPRDLMYIQSRLSLSLVWYKKGWLYYLGYIFVSYLNCLTMVVTMPLYSSVTRTLLKKVLHAYRAIFPYLLRDIPSRPREMNARTTKLIYKPAMKAMRVQA